MRLIQRFIGFQTNDGGRRAAGFKGNASDCVVRAIAITTGKDYLEVYKHVAGLNKQTVGKRSARNGVSKEVAARAHAYFGLSKVRLPKGPKPTFSEAYGRYGNCIVTSTGHECALVGGYLQDTADIRFYRWDVLMCERCASYRRIRKGEPIPILHAVAASGKCADCGLEAEVDKVGVYGIDRERKAMSVWIPKRINRR